MRVVIDTNILVSAVIRDRLPARVLLWCLERHDVEWVVTPAILEEYGGVIQRPKFKLPQSTISWWLDLIFAGTRLVQPRGSIDFARDRKDVAFLLCSQSCRADYLFPGENGFWTRVSGRPKRSS